MYRGNMSFPFEIKTVEEELGKRILKLFPCDDKPCIEVGPKKYVVPDKYRLIGPKVYNFKIRPDDTWIVTHPRSGTTWHQELIYIINSDLDFENAKQPLTDRFPQIEFGSVISDFAIEQARQDLIKEGKESQINLLYHLTQDQVPVLDKVEGKRYIKTHVPISLLPPKLLDTCKVIYVCRNPKDIAVSFFLLCSQLRNFQYNGDFPTFLDYFENNHLRFGPYWEHLREAWELRDHPNMLFHQYEDSIRDVKTAIRKFSAHLGKNLTDEQVQQVADHIHIDNFKKNKSVNFDDKMFAMTKGKGEFVRKGKSGNWKDHFTPELNARADKWIAENIARIPGFAFAKYE
ncbi:hypothetical protein B566_EDAN008412 [Ephemera danica]|nr:hypothetical protein B566_EDAN008412 [Ephemera danica]